MNKVYILFFKDFNPNKEFRKQSVQVKLINNTEDSLEDICRHISGIVNSTKFINGLGVTGGYWGLVSIIPESEVIEVTYGVK